MLGSIHCVLLGVPIVASFGVLLVTFGWLGPWACVPVTVWLLATPLLRTMVGERVFLRTGLEVRSLSENERTLLGPVACDALSRCGFDCVRVDWYIRRRERSVNAYAAGRRSIAVSQGLLLALATGSLAPEHARAVLLHEIGHLEDPSARRRLIVAWLTGPWRFVQAVLVCVVRGLAATSPLARGGILLLPLAAAIAIGQLARQQAWLPLAAVVALLIVVPVNPLVDAAISRRAELAADDYAARAGGAQELAATLKQTENEIRGGLVGLYSRHPSTSRRVERLTAAQSFRTSGEAVSRCS
jgi:hypothetical protein